MSPFRPEIVSAVGPSARRVLDIGCNGGGLALGLPAATVVGVEGDAAAAGQARKACARVHALDLDRDEIPEPDGAFDTIVYADVLEHLRDPWKALARHRRLLEPGGRAVVSVPNVQYWRTSLALLAGRWEYRPMDGGAHILAWDHLRFFTRRGIVSALAGAGYRVESVGSIGSPRFLPFAWGPLRGLATFQYVLVGRLVS